MNSIAKNVIINIIVFCVKNSICSLYPMNKNSNPDSEYDIIKPRVYLPTKARPVFE